VGIGTGGINTPEITIANNFTIMVAWYKANWNDGRTEQFLHDRDTTIGASGLELNAGVSAGNLQAGITINGTFRSCTYSLASLSPGLHYIGVQCSGGNVRLYVDGVNVSSNTAGSGSNPSMNGFTNMQVGYRKYWNGSSYDIGRYATGVIDSISLYNDDLTAAQMYELYATQNPRSTDLLAHWDLDENTGTTVADEVEDYSGTIGGAAGWVTGYAGIYRSVMVVTDTGGSSEQGIQQPAATDSVITGGLGYVAHAYVKADAGETIKLYVTPTGGGSAQSVSLIATGEWQHIVNIYTADAAATALAIKVTITNATAAAKTFYVDKVALNDGADFIDYFDRDTQGSGSTVYAYDIDTNSHLKTITQYTFIGTWNDVVSDFGYPQEINTAGAEATIKLARDYPDYGEGVDLDFGFEVRVFMTSKDHINGIPWFTGAIEDYIVDERKQEVDVKVFGNGADLNQYQLTLGLERWGYNPAYYQSIPGATWGNVMSIDINPTEDIILNKLTLKIAGSGEEAISMRIYEGNPDNDTLTVIGGSMTHDIDPGNTLHATSEQTTINALADYDFNFDDVVLRAGVRYYATVDYDIWNGSSLTFYGQGGDSGAFAEGTIPLGRLYIGRATINNASFGVDLSGTYTGLYCQAWGGSADATTVSYDSVDPSTVVREAMDNYQSQGGIITYDAADIPLSGTVISYDFKSATILDVIKKCLELAPVGWYFFVDHAIGKLIFKPKSTTAEHTFKIGQHLQDLVLEKRSRDVVNVIYFTGGELSPGVNFFKKYEDAASIALYGRKLLNYSDNRVTREATADTIANRILQTKGAIEVRTSPTVIDYDLESIKPGHMVAFKNYEATPGELSLFDVGKFDVARFDYSVKNPATFLVQIARYEYNPSYGGLTLSTTPPDVNKRIEDISRNLEKQQTLNNPDTPS